MPTVAAIPYAFDTLDARVAGLSDQIARLSIELDEMRRHDAVVSLAMQRLTEEQQLAARLQRDFLPKKMPLVGSVQFHTIYRPAAYVSGDLYDVTRLDEQHVGFYIADAVGHGMPAALLTMFMKNALVTKEIGDGTYRLLEPAQTIARLNNSLCAQNLSNATFATAAYGTINTSTLELCFSTAGHPNPVLIRDGAVVELKNDGALLGIFAGEPFHNCRVQLQRGDRVFCYTDGVETAFTDGEPSIECWNDELAERSTQPTSDLIHGLNDCLDRSSQNRPLRDDLTIIAIDIA